MASNDLAIILLTHNEESKLPDCLESVAGLGDETFVVDSGSTDRTVEIALAAGATVVEHPFENYAAQRNWAQQHLPIRSQWVLHLDADERPTPELVDEILRTLRQPSVEVDGFLLRRRTVFMGRWIRHGGHYPSYHLRLFRRGKGSCEERRYDQHFIVDGDVARMKNDYIDVVMSDLTSWSHRHVGWAKQEAKEMLDGRGRARQVRERLLGSPIERRRWMRVRLYGRAPMFTRALAYWAYRYLFRLGFLDGREGLIFHFLHGFWYRFLVDAMIHESRARTRRGDGGHVGSAASHSSRRRIGDGSDGPGAAR